MWSPFCGKSGKETLFMEYAVSFDGMEIVLSPTNNYLSLFEVTKGAARKLEKLHKDFLWNGGCERKKIHLVK